MARGTDLGEPERQERNEEKAVGEKRGKMYKCAGGVFHPQEPISIFNACLFRPKTAFAQFRIEKIASLCVFQHCEQKLAAKDTFNYV